MPETTEKPAPRVLTPQEVSDALLPLFELWLADQAQAQPDEAAA